MKMCGNIHIKTSIFFKIQYAVRRMANSHLPVRVGSQCNMTAL